MTCSMTDCDRAAIARGLCRRCYDREHNAGRLVVTAGRGRPRNRCATKGCKSSRWKPQSQMHCQVHELQLRYPSTRFGVNEWVAAFGAKPGMLEAVIEGIRSATRSEIDRGRLRLDERGREIPHGVSLDEHAA